MIVTLFNPLTADLEQSFLANPTAVGVTSLVLRNATDFALNSRILIGELGDVSSEIVSVNSAATDGMTIGITPAVYSHEADTAIYVLRFDEAKFYRSTTGITGPYNLLGTVALDVDDATLITTYDDQTGLDSYYYKMSVYNSVTALESALTDPVPGGGWARNQVGRIINEILQEVGDQQEKHITRAEVLGYFNDCSDDLTINVAKPYEFLKARTTLKPVAAQNYLNYPVDSLGNQTMWKFHHMDYNFLDPTTTPPTDVTYTLDVEDQVHFRQEFSNNQNDSTTQTDAIHKMSLDNFVNRFRFEAPFLTGNGTLYLHYYQNFPTLDSEGDLLITPTPKIYKLYTKMRYYNKRMITEPSFAPVVTGFQNEYNIEKAMYTKHNPKDVGTPRAFRPRDKFDKQARIR